MRELEVTTARVVPITEHMSGSPLDMMEKKLMPSITESFAKKINSLSVDCPLFAEMENKELLEPQTKQFN